LRGDKSPFLNNSLPLRPTAGVTAGSGFYQTALGMAEIARPMSLTREIACGVGAVPAHSALEYSPPARPESRYCTQAAAQRRKRCNDSVRCAIYAGTRQSFSHSENIRAKKAKEN
jgi:hypothetical protein